MRLHVSTFYTVIIRPSKRLSLTLVDTVRVTSYELDGRHHDVLGKY